MSKDKQVIRELQGRIRGLERGSKSRGSQLIRAASMPVTSSDSDTTSSDGASCGCCDPTNCAHYLQPLSNDDDCPEGPFGWEVNFGNSITLSQLCQNLTKDSEGNFELEYVGYGVWRSESFTCNGEATAGGCNSGGGSCADVYEEFAFDPGESAYVRLPGSPVCPEGCNASTPGGTSDMELETVSRPCYGENYGIYISNDGANWTRTGGSECDPIDISGIPPTAIGDIMNVPCAGDDGGAPSGTQYAWIQLTTDNTRDADGRSNTKLELIVGGVAAFTFRPRIGFDWCCSCENKMELQCCGPFAFQFIPESVCVKPMGPGDFEDKLVDAPDNWACCAPYFTEGDDETPKLPKYIVITIEAVELACPDGTCCEQASGMFVLEWDAFSSSWIYTFPPACDGTTTPFPLVEACNNTVCAVPVGAFGPHLWLDRWRIYCSNIAGEGTPIFTLELSIVNSEPIETPECTPPTCNVNFCFNGYGILANSVSGLRYSSEQCFKNPVVLNIPSYNVLCNMTGSAVALI